MPRIARERSRSGIYHVILRGANRQEIFHDEADSGKFLGKLAKYKEISEIAVYGWCLMGNHIHLLLQEGNEDLSVTMKRIGVSYACHYNWKYNTTGHLFQGRYRSEKVENDSYLLSVVRYIHQNPVKAGLVKSPAEWKWSSCQEYYGDKCYPPSLLDSDLVLGVFSENREIGVKKFIEYNETKNHDSYLDDFIKVRLTDEDARVEISKLIGSYEIANIKSLPKLQRDEIVGMINKIEGMTQRQASRILGIPLSLVNRA